MTSFVVPSSNAFASSRLAPIGRRAGKAAGANGQRQLTKPRYFAETFLPRFGRLPTKYSV